jgi:hypothetical protein
MLGQQPMQPEAVTTRLKAADDSCQTFREVYGMARPLYPDSVG